MKLNEMITDVKSILLLVFSLLLGVFMLIGGIKIAPLFGIQWAFSLVTILQFVGFALLLAVIIWPLIQDVSVGILKILYIVLAVLGILCFIFWLLTPLGWLTLSVVWFLWIDLFVSIVVIVFTFIALKE
ncbi:MAG: hypothetical protein H7644_08665 [Candidatus Heimdallarchaeota archaeon]|nr:hypothetical protein [Candidatus Heimdallarchaeota archaeon]MCK5143826.1 hypothetical protein [Candidatus Heimdallarchaeota archaeon]